MMLFLGREKIGILKGFDGCRGQRPLKNKGAAEQRWYIKGVDCS